VSDKAYAQHLARGGELLRADKIDDARVELEAAAALKPGDGKILNLLGLTYFRLGRYREAQEIYGELVGRQPEDAALRLNLGLVYLKTGAVEAAIGELQKAHDLEPGQMRTMGYLGLAYARKGKYALAREAFVAAGQDDLAREMEEQMLAPGPAVPTPVSTKASSYPPALDAPSSPPPAQSRPPAVVAAAVAAATHAAAAPAPDEEDEHVIDPSETSGVIEQLPENVPMPVVPNGPGAVTNAINAAQPRSGDSVVHRLPPPPPPPHALPITVTSFATHHLIRPDDGDQPFELAASGSLIVRVRGRVLSRTEGVSVSGGELSYEPATKRVRGRTTEDPFGSDKQPMFIVTGKGHLVAQPRGGVFLALQLVDDVLYVREDLVFAFEERLGWENGHVPGSQGDIPVVQFRGEGCLAIRTRRPPLTVKLAPEKVLYVDAGALAGWIGRVIPRVVVPAAGGDASAPFVECTGEGVVLVEELEPEPGLGPSHKG
jgi:uncharacterized protein (AIM24 family)